MCYQGNGMENIYVLVSWGYEKITCENEFIKGKHTTSEVVHPSTQSEFRKTDSNLEENCNCASCTCLGACWEDIYHLD